MLVLKPQEPDPLPWSDQLRRGSVCQLQEVAGMRSPYGLTLTTAGHLFESEGAHRLEQAEAVSSHAILLALHQTLVYQRGQPLQHIDRVSRFA